MFMPPHVHATSFMIHMCQTGDGAQMTTAPVLYSLGSYEGNLWLLIVSIRLTLAIA